MAENHEYYHCFDKSGDWHGDAWDVGFEEDVGVGEAEDGFEEAEDAPEVDGGDAG